MLEFDPFSESWHFGFDGVGESRRVNPKPKRRKVLVGGNFSVFNPEI